MNISNKYRLFFKRIKIKLDNFLIKYQVTGNIYCNFIKIFYYRKSIYFISIIIIFYSRNFSFFI